MKMKHLLRLKSYVELIYFLRENGQQKEKVRFFSIISQVFIYLWLSVKFVVKKIWQHLNQKNLQ